MVSWICLRRKTHYESLEIESIAFNNIRVCVKYITKVLHFDSVVINVICAGVILIPQVVHFASVVVDMIRVCVCVQCSAYRKFCYLKVLHAVSVVYS